MPLVKCPNCGGKPPYCDRCGYSGTIWQNPPKK
jgi:hypothetical protein